MKKLCGLMVVLVFTMAIFSGCSTSDQSAKPMYGEAAEIKIAVLGSEEQFSAREHFFIGMDLAIKELREEGINISYEKIDDEKNRDNGFALAKKVAVNNEYLMAFTFQVDEVVEAIAPVFNEVKKPLLILNEYCEEVMAKGFEYILAGLVSAEKGSKSLVKYCENNGLRWVAMAHSATEYELSSAKAFNNELVKNKNVNLLCSITGPNQVGEISDFLHRLDILGVQAVFLSFEDIEWACEVIGAIKKQNKDMVILGDARFDNLDVMEDYKNDLEGLVIVGSSSVESEEKLQAFCDKYGTQTSKAYDVDVSSVTAQAYDFIHMIAQNVKKSSSAQEFMKNMKSKEGYEGVTGIKFDEAGTLDELPEYWIMRNGQLHRID